MLSTVAALPAYTPAAFAAPTVQRAAAPVMETVEDLKTLSTKLNPVVGYYNPLTLGEASIGSTYDSEAAIGFLRHAEIKHGRVAMAAFVGYCVQSNFCFPWELAKGIPYSSIAAAGSPPAQWDAVPTAGKLQILLAVAALEMWGEGSTTLAACGEKHYMKGGKPGFYPNFDLFRDNVHPLPLDLWDPLGFTKKLTPEKKEKALLAEINNGRLAMIGIMGMISAAKGLNVPASTASASPNTTARSWPSSRRRTRACRSSRR